MSDGNGSALVPVTESAPAIPAPAFSGAQMESALAAYRDVQTALDRSMPDQLMRIGDKHFRKKGYWRAVARAFRLAVECTKEERISGESDWGFMVTYRATAPSGDTADGDGACSAGEKRDGQDTLHNVRAHAHTRAYNRAVSNLVGFGEVSAEEMPHEREERPHRQTQPARDVTPPREAPAARESTPQRLQNGTVKESHVRLLWARATARAKHFAGVDKSDILRDVLGRRGIEHAEDLPLAALDEVLHEIDTWEPPVDAPSDGAEAF